MLFVTGGTGYLGSALVELLVREGHAVRALVRSPEKASVLPEGVETFAGDISDEDHLAKGMDGCEGVFHFAAAMGGTWAESREGNNRGTSRVLKAARRAGVTRVVYTSSSAAIIRPDGLVSEQATENETALEDVYSVTKMESEAWVLQAARDGQDANIVNVVNAYGPSPAGPKSYNMLFQAAAAGNVPVVVDAQVAWVTAADVARCHLLAYEKGEAGKRYIACGEVATFPRVLNTFCELWGTTPEFEVLPPGSDIPRDKLWGHAIRSEVYGKLGPMQVDDAQSRALGFAPVGLDEGLRETVEWLRGIAG